MKEIGGYIEFETYIGSLYHENAIPLNCGRNCLAYLIETKKIKKLYLPYFLCSSVRKVCVKYGVDIGFYHINKSFRPEIDFQLYKDEWLYIVNFYGQISNDEVVEYKNKFDRIILDYAQSYFRMPLEDVDTIYTCRKFFGVSDGAFLYTDNRIKCELSLDESFERIHYILGRFERSASEFYQESADNNHFFVDEPIKQMSKLTANLLRSYDYDSIIKKRTENFKYLYEVFKNVNKLELTVPIGAFMYPLYIENSADIRNALLQEKIFVPTLWPDVFDYCDEDTLEYDYAKNILPLPVDQRYEIEDMKCLIDEVMKCIN